MFRIELDVLCRRTIILSACDVPALDDVAPSQFGDVDGQEIDAKTQISRNHDNIQSRLAKE